MRILLTAICLISTATAFAFDRPESVLVLGKNLYVTNMSGPGNAKDGVGWISKLDKRGKVVQEKWIDGLNAPKGMGFFKGQLYTSDIDEVVVIDVKKKSIAKIPVPGSKLLNDITIDSVGNLYVSDTFGSKVYRIDGESKAVTELVSLKEAPNGLTLMGDTLFIAGYGKAKSDATGVEDGTKGSLSTYDLKTNELKTIIPQIGRIDGIEFLKDGKLLLSVKIDEALYWVDLKEGKIVGSLQGANSFATFTDVADMGLDMATNTLYVPNTKTHDIQIIHLK